MRARDHVIGLVLAAGAGARMGGNKALLLVSAGAGDEPLARLHARRMRAAGADDVILVTRAEVAPCFATGEDAPSAMEVVVSQAADQAGSLAVGLSAVRRRGGAWRDAILVVTPVDAMPAAVETIAALVDAVRAGASAATPRMASGPDAGRGGHPVVVRAHVLDDDEAHEPAPLDARLAVLGDRRVRVDVDDPAIRTDLDTPADLLRVADRPIGPAEATPAPRFWKPR